MSNIDYWNFQYPPRKNQEIAMEWLLEQDKKYLILEAPVGTGKSFIGLGFADYLNYSSYIMTPQRILQKQYEDSFTDENIKIASLYGKSNYKCVKGTNCLIGGLLKPSCKTCPHKNAKNRALDSKHTVLNYRLALTLFAFTDIFPPRDLIIFDEGHTLESQLVEFDAHSITYARCKKYELNFKIPKTFIECVDWCNDYYIPNIKKKLEVLELEYNRIIEKDSTEITKSDLNKISEFDSLDEHILNIEWICSMSLDYLNDNFVLTSDVTMFTFKRLSGKYSFNKIVNNYADRFLFMSSTILNKEGYCADLGIPEKDVAFLSLDSEFKKENRPVVYMPQMKMNYTWKNNIDGKENMLSKILEILEIHKNDSGIIHAGNFEISKWLVENIGNSDNDHIIFDHNPESNIDRNQAIDEFQECKQPSLLISPSCSEGLDLKDDLGRFAIIVKIPFGHLGDQWIKKRMEMSQEWYMRNALIDVIQGGGRIVRSADDSGTVYILDQSWAYLYKYTRYMVPGWWKDAYAQI